MANEATLIFETEPPINMTCANGTGIEKGCCLKIADPFTASAASSAEDYVAGIAATEKIANDGKIKIGVYRGGIFRVTASGSIPVGYSVTHGAVANTFVVADATCSGSKIWGIALETAANTETFLMELRPGANNNVYS